MSTNLERLKRGEFGDAFVRKIPRTTLGFCITANSNQEFRLRLLDLETKWITVIYDSMSADAMGQLVERVMMPR